MPKIFRPTAEEMLKSRYPFNRGDKVRLKGGCEGEELEVFSIMRSGGTTIVSACHKEKGCVSLSADSFEKI